MRIQEIIKFSILLSTFLNLSSVWEISINCILLKIHNYYPCKVEELMVFYSQTDDISMSIMVFHSNWLTYKTYFKKKTSWFCSRSFDCFYYKKLNSRLLILDIKKTWYLKIVESINPWFSWSSSNTYINVKKIYSKHDRELQE